MVYEYCIGTKAVRSGGGGGGGGATAPLKFSTHFFFFYTQILDFQKVLSVD